MKFSVSAYSFMQCFQDGRLTPFTGIAKVKEMGFDAIEFVDFVFPKDEDSAEYAKKLRAEADRVGLAISNYAVGADFLSGSDGNLEAEVERLKGQVDIAAILGCPTMRHDVTGGIQDRTYQGYDTVIERLAKGCRAVTEYAAGKGVKTMTENHGFFSQDSLRVEKLINTVANENFGQLVDMGNFLCADDNPAVAVGRCAPYAFYVHAKDFIVKSGQEPDPGQGFFQSRSGNFLRGTIVGHGDVPVVQCLRALKRENYDGYVAIEFEGMEDCVKGVAIGLENLKKYVAEVYGG
ncbi:sugar phosphate isomerase/epimerase family protein [Acetatifactor aquisgranensis]|uniref:sugar phosphate isomerase/epimerase family protein n=1 Tax=Acetatifactor aquisgranensis TaxID=2941233 RepID=UPI00203A807E|nr:sugar phosphate isomerase/epimerase family protein [Acetatifactor aquisgranensis]